MSKAPSRYIGKVIPRNLFQQISSAACALILVVGCAAQALDDPEPMPNPESNVEEASMTTLPDPYVGFSKFIVKDLDAMEKFYTDVFGFEKENTVDFFTFEERVMRLPDGATSLVLYHHKDDREITVGNAHGPLGIMTKNVDEVHARALAAGAKEKSPPVDFGPVRVSFFFDPEGHEIELIDMTGATSQEAASDE